VHCQSIYADDLRAATGGGAPYDAAYFSGSLTLMPDPPAALRAAAALLREGGLIYVTQTFQNKPAPLMAVLKPLLRWVTTVDFGRLTLYAQAAQIVADAGMEIIEDAPVPGSIDTSAQTARLLVLRPGGVAQKKRS
jgi:ubiquinone/menaquinone biosynthesis C-methylase UbiE